MASTSIDHSVARAAMERAWGEIGLSARPPARMQQLIENVLGASDVTFKYILVTGYLAKFVSPAVHARALQVGSSLRGAYDARSLCHKVIVGFEKSKGNLFGLSNEPFVNKPARHPEHDGENVQLRNRIGAKQLHNALEQAQVASKEEVWQGLVHILRVGSEHVGNEKRVVVSREATLGKVVAFVEKFLAETDGGARLVGVWGAFQRLLSENGEIKVYSPNAPDFFGKTAGDVEIFYNAVLVSASECKQRPLNVDDVQHGIKKAHEKGLAEYLFVISAGVAHGQEKTVSDTVANTKGIDVALVDIWKEVDVLAAMLNPVRRAKFGECVVELLKEMRKFKSAAAAAELWNRTTG